MILKVIEALRGFRWLTAEMVIFYIPTLSSHFKFMSPRVFDKIFNYSVGTNNGYKG